MRLIVQTVSYATCTVDEKSVGSIENGYMVLVGLGQDDDEEKVVKMAKKLSKLRVFEDHEGKMNLDIKAVNGSILSISQFTLYADTNKGNRPSFVNAMGGEKAELLYQYFNECLRNEGLTVEEGVFGAHMLIDLCNVGPKTFILEV